MGQQQSVPIYLWSPLRFLVAVLVIIFTAEAAVMFLLPLLLPPNAPTWAEALADACLLSLLSAPILWRLIIHPLRTTAFAEQAKAAAILDRAADGIITINEQGIIESFNPAAEHIFGYKAEEIMGQSVNQLMPSPYREEHDGYLQRYLRTGKKRVIGSIREVLGQRKDGSNFPLEIRVSEVHLSSRRVFTAIVRDITERKAVEQQLRLHLTALEVAANAIVITDRYGNAEWANEAFANMTGYSLEEVRGKRLSILKSGKHDQAFYQSLWETILSGQVWQGEIINRRKSGDLYTEEMTITPVRNEQGEITHFIAIKQDITYRKQQEEELRQAKEAAENANRELIALNEHLEKTITWAKEEAMRAELASAAKSEFLANMSHEIRTPMNGVLGMTTLLLDTDLTPEQRDYAETIQSSAEALLTIINDILDFSKIEAGKVMLEKIDFNLRDCISDTMKTLAVRAHEKRLELAYHVPPDLPATLVGDPGRLRQILLNLIGNAIKFTEQGEVVLNVEVANAETARQRDPETPRPQDNGQVVNGQEVCLHFRVRDTGIGIPPDKQKHIFEAFAQADSSTTRKFGGTGLGLTICKNLVEMMGGRIWVESEVGKGSTFHFTARFGVAAPPMSAHALPAEDLSGLRVLVVDDHPMTRRFLEEMLAYWDMKPTTVGNGHDALEAMKRATGEGHPYAVVLLDMLMPDMDGFAVAECIQQDPQLTGTAIIILSSVGQRGDAARCKELGVAAYLNKPVCPADLLDAIKMVMNRQPAAASVPASPRPVITRHTLRESRRALRILLAEDNAVNQKVATRMLEKQGHSVVIASNGREALAAFEREKFDLILMDVQMPEMGGLEATALIRQREHLTGGHVPIVAMTAHATQDGRQVCLEAGMDGYIAKPIQASQLFQVIEELAIHPSGEEKEDGFAPLPEHSNTRTPEHVWNYAAALERTGGDPEFLKELVELFLSEYPKMMGDIQESVARRDAQALQRAAHTLKGSVGNFCATRAFEAAYQLEQMGRREDLSGVETAWAVLEKEMERLTQALATLQSPEGKSIELQMERSMSS